jgi:preprotein translocase subunit SecD
LPLLGAVVGSIGRKPAMPKSVTAFLLGLLFLGSSASLLTGCDRGDRVQLVLEAKRQGAGDEAMDKARDVVERRLGAVGASGVTVVRQGPNRLLATFAGARDTGPIKALIGRSARLEFRLVDLSVTREQMAAARLRPVPGSSPFPARGRTAGSPSAAGRSSTVR